MVPQRGSVYTDIYLETFLNHICIKNQLARIAVTYAETSSGRVDKKFNSWILGVLCGQIGVSFYILGIYRENFETFFFKHQLARKVVTCGEASPGVEDSSF